MTKKEWLEKASQPLVLQFVRNWHPVIMGTKRSTELYLPITAEAPEAARQNCIAAIRAEAKPGDPTLNYVEALEKEDWSTANTILNEAWFGVPESTNCWKIPGFPEAVELMEDPPEEVIA